MRLRFALCVCLVMAILAFHPSTSFAQAIATARLSGTVTDPSGGVVAKAQVTVSNTSTSISYTGATNDSGFYVLPSLPPGTYNLAVTSSGFANYRQTGIVLTVGQSATVDVALQLATAGEKVVVTAETPMIEPTKTEISQVVSTQQIGALPTQGRQFIDFALLTPGVATSRTSLGTSFTEFEVTQISFGGMRSFSNMIAVDGADFVNAASGVQRATPPQESVQEFRVVNNSFGAEYGRSVGGIVNIVTKSGTNDLHGEAYEYFQNNALNARYLLQTAATATTPALPNQWRQNQFGGVLSGPVKKDKSFFWLNYEGKRSAQSPIYPPDLVNNILLIDQSKAVMGLAPEGCNTCAPNTAITQTQAFNYLKGYLRTGNDDWGFARFDQQVSTNNRLALRYNIEDTRALGELVGATLDGGGVGVPSGGRNLFTRDQAVVGTLSTVISSNLVNQFMGQWAQRHYNFPGSTGQPDFSILNDLELGHNFGTNDRLYETRFELGDSISWVKGNHNWKFGGDANLIWSQINFPGFTPVRSLIPTAGPNPIDCLANFAQFYNDTFLALPPLPPGSNVATHAAGCGVPQDHGVVFVYGGVPLPTGANACGTAGACLPTVTAANAASFPGVGPANGWANAYPQQFFDRYTVHINHGYWAGFIQDQWRITPKLSLNYGVRWEFESGLSSFIKSNYNGWQPRIGLAYSPDSKTVIRAGFGLFDDRQNMTFFFVPNTQKIVAGYQCANNAPAGYLTSPACTNPFGAPGAALIPQQFSNIRSNNLQGTQGYQIFGFPAAAIPFGGGNLASFKAAGVIATGGYDGFENAPNQPNAGLIPMSGACSTTGACGVGEGGMERHSGIPYASQASLEIDRQFGGGFALSLSYLFVGAHKLVRGNNINVPCPLGTTDTAQAANPTDPGSWTVAAPFAGLPDWRPGLVNANGTFSKCSSGTPVLSGAVGQGPAIAGLGPWFVGAGPAAGLQTMSSGLEDYNNNVANAAYNGLTVTGMERVGKYFNMTANYTYSHTIDNGNFTTFINLPVNQFDYAMERSNSNQDLRHRFVTNFTANTPTTGWYRNFEFSSIITLQAGRPFTLYYGANTFNDVAGGAVDRVGGAPLTGTHCATTATCQTVIARNTYLGDTLYSWDLRLSRVIHTTERTQLILSADAFNVLNRPNVDEVTSVYGSPVFCGGIPRNWKDTLTREIQSGSPVTACPVGDGAVIPFAGSYSTTPITAIAGDNCSALPLAPGSHCMFIPAGPNANFGQPRTVFNPRQIQFGVKFSF